MATEEARAMLDALMGGDRNAPLPSGAAVPQNQKVGRTGELLLPGKRQKSCFDKDICPLYTAWGVDVYDLFINTKSDLGTNPYVVDEGAHKEFMALDKDAQERTGYHYFLFQKLQELVWQCDRTVTRNKEKLKRELSGKLSQRGGQDFVEDVDQGAVENLVRDMCQVEYLTEQWKEAVLNLDQVVEQLEPLLQAQKLKSKQEPKQELPKEGDTADDTKDEEENDNSNHATAQVKEETKVKEEDESATPADDEEQKKLQLELGKLTLEKQRLLYDISRIISRLAPLQEAVETQHRNLNYVKSDISTDKTVCEVSGNFMSSRDADERIAAHYAGKQYVGWKLVRDKLQEMIQTYGRHGPSPPPRENRGPEPPMPRHGGGGYSRGGGGPRGGGGYNDRGRHDGGSGYRGGGGGGGYRGHGGGGFHDRGHNGPPPSRGGNWRR